MKRLFIAGIMIVLSLTLLAACSGDSGKDSGEKSAGTPKFDFSDISWEVKSGIKEGNRVVVFGFDNNSKYDIGEFDLQFKLKDDVEEDDLKDYPEVKDKIKDMEEEPEDMTIDATTNSFVKAGESTENHPVSLDGTVQYFTDYDAYELFEPDRLSIGFIHNGKIYMAYYDYVNKETTCEDTGKKAYEWSESELAKKLPKPDTPIVVVSNDDKDSFNAEIMVADAEYFEAYKKECMEKGFDQKIDSSDWMWTAFNKEGNKLELMHSKEDNIISLYLDEKE